MTAGEILGLAITVSIATVANVVIVFKAWVTIQKKVSELDTQNKFNEKQIVIICEKVDRKVDMDFMNEFKADLLTRFEEIKQGLEKIEERLYNHTHKE